MKRSALVHPRAGRDAPLLVDRIHDLTVRGVVRNHPVAVYFMLAFALSWSYWIPDALTGGHWSHFPGLLGPAVAALVVAVLSQRGEARMLRTNTSTVRVAPRWYAAALIPIVVAVLVLGARAALGSGLDGSLSRMHGLPDVGWIGVAALVLVVNGFGEEIGWRGFAWPHVRENHSLGGAAVLVGVTWALWHLPLFWIDSGMRGFAPAAFPGFAFSLVCGAVVLGWLYDRAGSVAVVALWHTMFNMATGTDATIVAAPFVSVVVIVWAVWILRTQHVAAAPREAPPPGQAGRAVRALAEP